jgi:hypothetical protein
MNKERAIEIIRDVVADSHPHLKEKIQSFDIDLPMGIDLPNFDTSAFEGGMHARTGIALIISYCDSIEDVYANHEPLFRGYTE